MPLAGGALQPSLEEEQKKHKKTQLVQSPNSYFMYVKYPGSCKITYSQAYTVVFGVDCSTVVPANRRKGQTQKDVHLEESNTNDPQFPESVSCRRKPFQFSDSS